MRIGFYPSKNLTTLDNAVIGHFNECGSEIQMLHEPRSDRLPFWLWQFLFSPFDVFYTMGYQQWGNRFRAAKWLGRKTVIHWIGTDIYHMMTDPKRREIMRTKILPYVDQHWVVSETNARELEKTLGVKTRVVPIVFHDLMPENKMPLPAKPAMLTYGGEGKFESFYGLQIFYNLARRFPEYEFSVLVHTGKGVEDPPPNLHYLGWVEDMNEVYAKHSIILRLTVHDGLPKMVLEGLAWGRQIIYSQPLPHCHLAANLEEAEAALKKILAEGMNYNCEGREYVLSEFNKEKMTKIWSEAITDLE